VLEVVVVDNLFEKIKGLGVFLYFSLPFGPLVFFTGSNQNSYKVVADHLRHHFQYLHRQKVQLQIVVECYCYFPPSNTDRRILRNHIFILYLHIFAVHSRCVLIPPTDVGLVVDRLTVQQDGVVMP
jgi:hypothetical protein